jgi:hypothetical protein
VTADAVSPKRLGKIDLNSMRRPTGSFFAKVVNAQFSFSGDEEGHATQFILHQNGVDKVAKRIDEVAAKRIEAKIATKRGQGGDPLAETALRRHINELHQG